MGEAVNDLRDKCARINAQVNTDVTYFGDPQNYGVPDYWTEVRGRGIGDCEDYALTKRRLLLEAGVSHDVIFFDVCLDETGQGHAVLRVRLDDTDVVLDNRQPSLATPADLRTIGYRFISHIRSDGVGGWRVST